MQAVNEDLVWMNGEVMPVSQAKVGIEDRGFNFADGVYEVVRFYNGRPFTLREHMQRLERSAHSIQLAIPLQLQQLEQEIRTLIARSGFAEGMVYLQLTRGESHRAHAFPDVSKPTLFFYTRRVVEPWQPGEGQGVSLVSVTDERWSRCDIKSLALLPNVLAKQHAVSTGHDEAVFIHVGTVTECCASNIFMVGGGKVLTHPAGTKVLPGITRLVLKRIATQLGIEFVEEAVSLEQAVQSEEVFITSTTRELNWAKSWDGHTIGRGHCGATTRRLHEAYVRAVAKETRSSHG